LPLALSSVFHNFNVDSKVRLIAAQLVALVEKVGDKDKVKRNFQSPAIQHLMHFITGSTFQEEYKASNLGND
jgi:hypothetical protein